MLHLPITLLSFTVATQVQFDLRLPRPTNFARFFSRESLKLRMMYYSVSDIGILGKKSECSYQVSNLRPSDYYFGLPLGFFSEYACVTYWMIHHSHLFTRLKIFHHIGSGLLVFIVEARSCVLFESENWTSVIIELHRVEIHELERKCRQKPTSSVKQFSWNVNPREHQVKNFSAKTCECNLYDNQQLHKIC